MMKGVEWVGGYMIFLLSSEFS